MPLKMFQALPSYNGGKRRLLGAIFRHVPPSDEAPVFVDAFLGGGSVALYAKCRGHQVVCNDIAERSVIVGKALIESEKVRLSHDDLVRLCVWRGGPGYAEKHLAPDVFPVRHARFLDTALANARRLEGPKKWSSLLLIIKYALRLRPMGNWGAVKIIHQIADGAYEEMNQNYVRDVFSRGIHRHPFRIAEDLR
ncbi:MAG: DNA adenine methylase, partial [Candidatus Eisenbacteria bacterium]